MKKNPGLPSNLIVHLSLTGNCNFRCTICPSSREDRKYKRPDIDSPLLDFIVKTVLPHCSTLILGGNSLGEVTTHKYFPLFLNGVFSKHTEMEMRLTTNGYRIGDFAANLARKFSFISISFDGATRETYESIRRYPFEKIIRNIEKLSGERTRAGSGLKIGLGMTLLYKNIHELPALIDLAADLGVDMVVGSFFIPNFPSERNQCLYYHQKYANDIADIAAERAERRGITFKMPRYRLPDTGLSEEDKRSPYMKCELPFTMINISETGKVTPCCANPTIMGDLMYQGIEDIWNGIRYARFRKNVGANLYCRICHTPVFGEHASTGYMLDPSYQIKTIGSDLSPLLSLRAGAFQFLSNYKTGSRIINLAKGIAKRK